MKASELTVSDLMTTTLITIKASEPIKEARADWVQSTYITTDTQAIAAEASEALIGANTRFAKEAARFKDAQLPPELARKIKLLRLSMPVPAPADPAVRRTRADEIELVLPACVAMFTEEVGVSPVAADGGASYRARVAELIRSGRAFARIEEGRVVFKAEVGSATHAACQVQGVWVPPDLRGRGLSAPGMAAVAVQAMADIAPVVSLYVNDFNHAARTVYQRCGFTQVGTFATVLF